jgi:hypothetical protein
MGKERVVLDGGSFIGADLRGKVLIYRGGAAPNLAGANIAGVDIELEDVAARTILTLAYIETASPGLIGKLLEKVRKDLTARTKKIPTH